MANASLIQEDVGQLLQEAGCTDEFTHQFLVMMKTENPKTLLHLLRGQRSDQLDRLHEEERKLDRLFHGLVNLNLQGASFGCSTLSVSSPEGGRLFGRNFDWGAYTTLIVQTQPKNGYASVSTVNMDFLNLGLNLSESAFVRLMSAAAPYAPMDGMNEKEMFRATEQINARVYEPLGAVHQGGPHLSAVLYGADLAPADGRKEAGRL